ncbi:hypothetical protein B0H13DRAFT_1853520 [Mycena leptocephala]|nr:hypothetical protein B0H13DRAFT_1853520 [Mycena leptocephala]
MCRAMCGPFRWRRLRVFTVAEDTTPSWFYCQQTGHCGQGDPHSFMAFQALAIQLNGAGAVSASATEPAVTTDASFTTPPAQSWAITTATVSDASSTWTTVYISYGDCAQ